jgi:hypothetical protein
LSNSGTLDLLATVQDSAIACYKKFFAAGHKGLEDVSETLCLGSLVKRYALLNTVELLLVGTTSQDESEVIRDFRQPEDLLERRERGDYFNRQFAWELDLFLHFWLHLAC